MGKIHSRMAICITKKNIWARPTVIVWMTLLRNRRYNTKTLWHISTVLALALFYTRCFFPFCARKTNTYNKRRRRNCKWYWFQFYFHMSQLPISFPFLCIMKCMPCRNAVNKYRYRRHATEHKTTFFYDSKQSSFSMSTVKDQKIKMYFVIQYGYFVSSCFVNFRHQPYSILIETVSSLHVSCAKKTNWYSAHLSKEKKTLAKNKHQFLFTHIIAHFS